MPFGNIIDENIKSFMLSLLIFETRIAITIMTNHHQYHQYNRSALLKSIDVLQLSASIGFNCNTCNVKMWQCDFAKLKPHIFCKSPNINPANICSSTVQTLQRLVADH